MEKENIIDFFIEATPHWINGLKDSVAKDLPCFYCGIIPNNMVKLAKEIEVLKEKAWKYDQLSK